MHASRAVTRLANMIVRKSRNLHGSQGTDPMGLFLCRLYVQNGWMIYGYARVSTDGQSVDTQVRQLKAVGCEKVDRVASS